MEKTEKKRARVELVEKGAAATLYTIIFEGEDETEFGKFMIRFKDNAELNKDLLLILNAVANIAERGALERYFRPEGKMSDNVVALPVVTCKLRLYCIRLTDKILILGNGGVKNSRTYNESEELRGYVMDLQRFDKVVSEARKRKLITIEETEIKGIEDATFRL